MEMEKLKEWIFEEQRKKWTWWNRNIFRSNLTRFEEDNLKQVYGKLMMMDSILKKMGVSKSERLKYCEEEKQ